MPQLRRNQYMGRTACSRGHTYEPGSFTLVLSESTGERTKRHCLICDSARRKAWRERRKAASCLS